MRKSTMKRRCRANPRSVPNRHNIHYLFPPDGQEPRGGFVVRIWRIHWWAVEHWNAMGGRRTLHRTNWTGEAFQRMKLEARRLGARAICIEDVYK